MVKRDLPVIKWVPSAEASLRKAYQYIKENSLVNAEMVKTGITEMIDKLPENPQRHGIDKFKRNNPGNYRAFEKYNYRIAYTHTDKEIYILRIRHVRQEPLKY